MPKRNPIKRPLPPYLTSSDMVNIRAAIKAGEKRSHAQIVELVKQLHQLRDGKANYDQMCNLGERLEKVAQKVYALGDVIFQLSSIEIRLNELGEQYRNLSGEVANLVMNPDEFLRQENAKLTSRADNIDMRLNAIEGRLNAPSRLTRLYRRAVAWCKQKAKKISEWRFKCDNMQCPICRPEQYAAFVEAKDTYNRDHPMTKGDRCGFVPPTPGYGPCIRDKGHDGPCAHDIEMPAKVTTTDPATIESRASPKTPCPAAIGNGSEYDANCAACRAANGEGE